MSFHHHLREVCQGVEGAIACSLMGVDGIEVETHVAADAPQLDLRSLLVEYSGILRSAREAAAEQKAGELCEVSINTDRLLAVARLVSADYFIVLALQPEANYGKARYQLRIVAPKVRAEL